MSFNFYGPRAVYSFTVENGVICIIDHDEGKSVTNDAENVIADLVKQGIDVDTQPVIYRDTRGIWDQLLVKNGRFYTFKSVNERDKELAKAKVNPLNLTC